jgi:hypothetical protein
MHDLHDISINKFNKYFKMNFYFCLYSNRNYEIPRKALRNLAEKSGIFNSIFEYDREWLEKTDLYLENINIFDSNSRGDGWCLWKPYVILESLKKIKKGEILLYMDSTDTFSPSLNCFLRSHFVNNDFLLCQFGESPNKNYTKRDTFFYMGCDSQKYWNSIQLEAGVIGIRKNDYTISIISEYLEFCKDERILKDGPNLCGLNNFSSYIDHRYDQSVLTNLKTKYSIVPSTEIRNHVECNIWESMKYQNIDEFERKISIMKNKCGQYFNDWKFNYLIHFF